ncbi:MAG: DsrE family protein [Chromatiales bacterium]|nr:DsrE family protein [Chromatiales bacterium]
MMQTSVRRPNFLLAAFVTLAFLAFATVAPQAQAQERNVVVHLGSYNEDLASALMALALANNLQKASATVTVYLDRNAVRMAETRQPLHRVADRDLDPIVSEFVRGGGRFLVCGHCADIAGLASEGIRPGFTIGSADDIVKMFMAADIVIDF